MKLLAIDSSTEACSVALLNGEELCEQFLLTPREHTQRLLPMVDEVLAESGLSLHQLDAIAFGRGPGSFTGLRICLGAVQGLAFGAGLPVVPVSSLAALAQTALDRSLVNEQHGVIAAIDARMDEIYWSVCRFENGLARIDGKEQLSSPEQLVIEGVDATMAGMGSGWCYADRIVCSDKLDARDNTVLPAASAVVKLAARDFAAGISCSPDQAVPVYLRDEVAWKKSS